MSTYDRFRDDLTNTLKVDRFIGMKLLPARIIFIFAIISLIVASFSLSYGVLAAGISADYGTAADIDFGESGDVVSYVNGAFILSSVEYDDDMFGVITANPIVGFKQSDLEEYKMISSEGQAFVKVSAINGNISVGDYITTSTIAGVAQKAAKPGKVLGMALEEFSSDDPEAQGVILTMIDIQVEFVNSTLRTNLFETLRTSLYTPFLTPLTSLRYVLAFLIVVVTFATGFWSFGKFSTTTILAVGRNPLAQKDILRTLITNLIITLFVMGVGLGLAYIILTF